MDRIEKLPMNALVTMTVCTAGWRQVLINGEPYRVSRGMIYISTPLVFVTEQEQSSDYEDVVLGDQVGVIFQTVRHVFGTLWTLRLFNKPCHVLDDEHFAFFIERARLIARRRKLLETCGNTDEHRLLEYMIHLLEQEAVLEFIYMIYKQQPAAPESEVKFAEIAYRFAYSVTLHFRTERTVAYYAAEAHLSPTHFSRIIKENTGKKPSEWIAMVTILNAQSMLAQTDKSIKEIAEELNFPEQFTFRKYFKHHTGMAPKEYRKRQKVAE